MRRRVLLAFFLAGCAFAAPAHAANPAGSAVDVVQQAQGALDGSTIVLSKGDGIFMGQTVITGPAGRVQVVFADDTHMVIGPGSRLVIDQYLMRNDGTASKFVVNALAGTFRFVTGNSRKNAYEIKTPTGTMGVRGTAFDFAITPKTGETTLLLYEGGVSMCARTASCVMVTEACSVAIMQGQGKPTGFHAGDRRRPLKSFPYLNSQNALQTSFRVSNARECGGRSAPAIPVFAENKKPLPPPPAPPPADPPPTPPEPPPEPEHHHHHRPWWWHPQPWDHHFPHDNHPGNGDHHPGDNYPGGPHPIGGHPGGPFPSGPFPGGPPPGGPFPGGPPPGTGDHHDWPHNGGGQNDGPNWPPQGGGQPGWQHPNPPGNWHPGGNGPHRNRFH